MQTLFHLDEELSIFARGAPALTPAQQAVASELTAGLAVADVSVLRVSPGMGRTTILQSVHALSGGGFVAARQFLNLLAARSPNALEESFLDLLTETRNSNQVVFVDDLHLLMQVVYHYNYQRTNLINTVMTTLLDEAVTQGKKLYSPCMTK